VKWLRQNIPHYAQRSRKPTSRNILHNFHIDTPQPTTSVEDNQGAISVNYSRMKPIDVKLHFTRQMIQVKYIATQAMRADMLSNQAMFEKHRQLLMALNI
jgi:hypothetical protein